MKIKVLPLPEGNGFWYGCDKIAALVLDVRVANHREVLDVEGFHNKDPEDCFVVTRGEYKGCVLEARHCVDASKVEVPVAVPTISTYRITFQSKTGVGSLEMETEATLCWTSEDLRLVEAELHKMTGTTEAVVLNMVKLDGRPV